jgi:hypothetical protein
MERFYGDLQSMHEAALKSKSGEEGSWPIIGGDFNIHLGLREVRPGCIGNFPDGYYDGRPDSKNVDYLYDFCLRNDYVITNSFFRFDKDRQRCSWSHPGTHQWTTKDLFLVHRSLIGKVGSTRARHSATLQTDHELIVLSKGRGMLKQQRAHRARKAGQDPKGNPRTTRVVGKEHDHSSKQQTNKPLKFNLTKLTSKAGRAEFEGKLAAETVDRPSGWKETSEALLQTMRETLPLRGKSCRETWFGNNREQFEKLFAEARLLKSRHRASPTAENLEKVKQNRRDRKRACRKAKTIFNAKWGKSYEEEIDPKAQTGALNTLLGEGSAIQSGNVALGPEVFATHFGKLFSKESLAQTLPNLSRVNLQEKISEGVPELREVALAVKSLKSGKASGLDGIPPEAFKAGGEVLIKRLTADFAVFWPRQQTETGAVITNPDDREVGEVGIPEGWMNAELVPLFKNKGSPTDPGNYRGIFLLEIAGKVLAKVIVNRISIALEQVLSDTQCGFRPRRSTAHMIFALRQLQTAATSTRTPLAAAFIDLKKAFDSPPREAIWECLGAIGCPNDLLAVIKAIHRDPKANVRGSEVMFSILRGVRQGCVLGPALFGLLFDFVLKLSGLESELGATLQLGRVGARGKSESQTFTFGHGEFADDGAIIGTPAQLTEALNRIQAVAGAIGLDIHAGKTEWLWLQPPEERSYSLQTDNTRVFLGGEHIKHVRKFRYLGSLISEGGGLKDEIDERISAGRGVLDSHSKVWANPAISIRRKIRLATSKVFPSLFYACETWTTVHTEEERLEAFLNLIRLKILGRKRYNPLTGEVVKNDEIRMKVKFPTVRHILAQRRLAFYTQLIGAPSCGLATAMVNARIVGSVQVRGRTVRSWNRLPLKDLSYLTGINEEPLLVQNLEALCLLRGEENGKAKVKAFIRNTITRRGDGPLSPQAVPRLISNRTRTVGCSLCWATFAEKKAVMRHMRTDHDATLEEISELTILGQAADQQNPNNPHETPSTTKAGDLLGGLPAVEELDRDRAGKLICPATRCLMVYKTYGHLRHHCVDRHALAEGVSGHASTNSDPEQAGKAARPSNTTSSARAIDVALTVKEAEKSLGLMPIVISGGGEPSVPSSSWKHWGEPPCWDGSSIECTYVRCAWGSGESFTVKALLNHMTSNHDWNMKGHCPKRTRKSKCAPLNDPVGSQAVTSGGVGEVSTRKTTRASTRKTLSAKAH